MILELYKKAVETSSTALSALLKKHRKYDKEINFTEIVQRQVKFCSDNIQLLYLCLFHIKKGAHLLQKDIDQLKKFYAQQSKIEQRRILPEVEDLEKRTGFFQLINDAQLLVFAVEERLIYAKTQLVRNKSKKVSSAAIETPCVNRISPKNSNKKG